MIKNGMKLETVKKQMETKYYWWKFDYHLKHESGEENLYYIQGDKNDKMNGETLVFFFDKNKRLRDTDHLDWIIS